MLEDSDVALTSLLPLFHEQAKSVAMICHSMDVVKTVVEIRNPGQVPVIIFDQPLYTLGCKENQVELDNNSWRESPCCDVWWATY